MPHYIGLNRKITIVERKVFENFNCCEDTRTWETACLEQSNDSYREVCVNKMSDDPDEEHLRQWLLKNGATIEDEYVILEISW